MRYPNLRYGHHEEMKLWAIGIPFKQLAKELRRDERTVSDWLNGKKKVPFWVPELLRLRHFEHMDRLQRMMPDRFDKPRSVNAIVLQLMKIPDPRSWCNVSGNEAEAIGRMEAAPVAMRPTRLELVA